MKEEIVKFYEKRGHHIHKLVNRRPSGIHPDKIMIAADKVYRRVQAGENIGRIMLAREVWRVADDIPNKELNDRLKRFTVSDDMIKNLIDEARDYRITTIILLLAMLAISLKIF